MIIKNLEGRLKSIPHGRDRGFVITVEVMATLVVLTMFLSTSLYVMKVCQVQSYFNTVMTSTAAEASRWGGTNTRPFRENVSTTPILVQAQSELNRNAANYNARITGNPARIMSNSDRITIRIDYSLPSPFSASGGPGSSYNRVQSVDGSSTDMYSTLRNMHMQVSVYSIMQPGRLL